MFVRNPTKDWSEIGVAEPPLEGGYDKQALKAMIERKRQNDFVRKREFDQLRKLRNRDPATIANMARPSYFQTSMPTDPDGRAVTLKKIDEIEAQMSKQWWKGKQEGAGGVTQPAPTTIPGDAPELTGGAKTTNPGDPFPTTAASTLHKGSDSDAGDFAETQVASGMAQIARSGPATAPHDSMDAPSYGSGVGFSSSELFSMDSGGMQTDPELEEAAIRFANGDFAGAETGLLAALRVSNLRPEVALSWAAALMDLYRATNNRQGFDRAILEFGFRFDRNLPQWVSFPSLTRELAVGSKAAPAEPAPGLHQKPVAIWSAPASVDEAAMNALRDALSSNPMPWVVDWSGMRVVSPDATPLLGALFASLCAEPVSVCFLGADALSGALRSITPSGNRSVGAAVWQVRLDALRAMHMQDEFELAALDYCVTFEVAPPGWVQPACHFTENHVADTPHQEAMSTMPMTYNQAAGAANVELWGEVLGDASQELARMDPNVVKTGQIIVTCQGLVRVDFSAAGSILNWVAMRQAEGAQVHFRNVHRLVAAFFTVIGINEHARIIPRAI